MGPNDDVNIGISWTHLGPDDNMVSGENLHMGPNDDHAVGISWTQLGPDNDMVAGKPAPLWAQTTMLIKGSHGPTWAQMIIWFQENCPSMGPNDNVDTGISWTHLGPYNNMVAGKHPHHRPKQ
jgi:hypothetical protein